MLVGNNDEKTEPMVWDLFADLIEVLISAFGAILDGVQTTLGRLHDRKDDDSSGA